MLTLINFDFSPFIYSKLNPLYKKFLPVLILAQILGILFFGWYSLILTISGWFGAGIPAFLFSYFRNKKMDQSFWITGFLTAFCLPVHLSWWMVFSASAFGQIFAKEVYGSFGKNIFNPAITGRIFLTLSFPAIFTRGWLLPDSVTGSTPMMIFRSSGVTPDLLKVFIGNCGGCMVETSALFWILALIYLYRKKIGNILFSQWFLISFFLFSTLGWLYSPVKFVSPLIQIFSGGILCGAALFCTDPVTGPKNRSASIFAGFLLGFLTLMIRCFSTFPEGMMYGLLITNMFTPMIDDFFIQRKKTKQ